MDNIENLLEKRVNYKDAQSTLSFLSCKEPFENFANWFKEVANDKSVIEPNAMALATSTLDGKPSVRMVLLKKFSKEGFSFFTNLESRKAEEMEANPKASLLFYWASLNRQIRIEGSISKLTNEVAEEYFSKRPKSSQISATLSHQSKVVASREVLEKKRNELEEVYENKSVPKPSFWGGYILKAEYFEFWQGQTDRLHDRIIFRKSGQSEEEWIQERLYP